MSVWDGGPYRFGACLSESQDTIDDVIGEKRELAIRYFKLEEAAFAKNPLPDVRDFYGLLLWIEMPLYREMLALVLSLHVFKGFVRNSFVSAWTDNTWTDNTLIG